jgi:hypothetical protein
MFRDTIHLDETMQETEEFSTKIETRTGKMRAWRKYKRAKRRNHLRFAFMNMEEQTIDREVETTQKEILTKKSSKIFGSLNILSIITSMLLLGLFGTKFWFRFQIKTLAR